MVEWMWLSSTKISISLSPNRKPALASWLSKHWTETLGINAAG